MHWAVLSPIIIVGWALILIVLERVFPYEPRQRLLRTGFFTDLIGYGLLQSYALGFLITSMIALLDRHTGWSKLGLVSGWPVLVQLIFFFLVHDFYIYWFHRLQHHSNLLWRIHEAHHSVDDVDWMSGTRSHALEIVINQTIEFAPIVLLGAAPEVALMKATLDAVWGMYIHSNIDVHAGLLQRVLNGPEMHRWHHATELEAPGRNFATKLAIWDFLFGTAYLPAHKPAAYGLKDADYPKRGFFAYVQQHAHSLRLPKETSHG
ncbi:MAG TPA: sterol desaturase family protein [Polyangiaceae bacterium]|nr:sterol desaturase family protein [Polyangiaceae bacterium]